MSRSIRISRRCFLQAMTVATLIPTVQAAAKPLIGSQLYGWGQYYSREGKDLWKHMDEVLSALRDSGYDYAEGSLDWGSPENNFKFAEQLKGKGMQPVALYSGGRLHEKATAEKTVDQFVKAAVEAKKAGFSVINCNPDPIGREKSDQELATQAEALKRLGKELSAAGMKFGIHNHTPEMVNHAREFHFNFQKTEPQTVGFCFDVDWVNRGGVKPEQALKDYGKRIVSWHLRQSRDGVWWEDLDEGEINYPGLLKAAMEKGAAPVYTVELALEEKTRITRSVVENHRRSIKYLKSIL
ncbi:MAG: TIM barrel protein [Verrucomicrobiota bacterium]|nr:TIM barrel protein [Verrucomicrobiota bacterium]